MLDSILDKIAAEHPDVEVLRYHATLDDEAMKHHLKVVPTIVIQAPGKPDVRIEHMTDKSTIESHL